MNRILIVPAWRSKIDKNVSLDSLVVELVERPDAAWFEDKKHVRFAFMSDGRLLFGDGMTVVHHDICQACLAPQLPSGVPVRPFVVGVFVRKDEYWRIANAQEFLHGESEGVLASTRFLLRALVDWSVIVSAMGNDPARLESIDSNE